MRLIDAEQIRELVAPIAPMLVGNDVRYERIAFMDEIDRLPEIEAKPVVHAHWVDIPNYWECSNCGETYWSMNHGFIYCPHCGAKMDEEGK